MSNKYNDELQWDQLFQKSSSLFKFVTGRNRTLSYLPSTHNPDQWVATASEKSHVLY